MGRKIYMGFSGNPTKGVQMNSLPEVLERLEYVTGTLEEVIKPEHNLKHEELTGIRDDLNECAEAVQTIRDMIVFE